jgi:hypothetical protein
MSEVSYLEDHEDRYTPAGHRRLNQSRMAGVPFVPWPQFRGALEFKADQHCTILGPTGRGKTTLGLELIKTRPFQVIIAAKPQDPALQRLLARGYVRVKRWPKKLVLDPDKPCKILFWPDVPTIRSVERKAPLYQEALDAIMRMGGWTVYIDEGLYSVTFLGLKRQLEDMWQRARTQHISLVFSAQRAANVPQLAYDQVDHIFTAKENDRRNAERIGEMASQDRLEVREIVQQLKPFEFLYIGVRDEQLCVTKAPKPSTSTGGKR